MAEPDALPGGPRPHLHHQGRLTMPSSATRGVSSFCTNVTMKGTASAPCPGPRSRLTRCPPPAGFECGREPFSVHLAQSPALSSTRITVESNEQARRSRIGRTLSLGQVAEGMGLESNLLQILRIANCCFQIGKIESCLMVGKSLSLSRATRSCPLATSTLAVSTKVS